MKFIGIEDQIDPAVIDYVCRGDMASVQKLLLKNLSPHSEDYHYGSLLYLSTSEKQWEIAKLLVEFGANPFYESECFISAFDLSLKLRNKEMALFFIENSKLEYFDEYYLCDCQKMNDLFFDVSILSLLLEKRVRIDLLKYLRFHHQPLSFLSLFESLSSESFEYYITSFDNSLNDLLTWGDQGLVRKFCEIANEKLNVTHYEQRDNILEFNKERLERDILERELKAV